MSAVIWQDYVLTFLIYLIFQLSITLFVEAREHTPFIAFAVTSAAIGVVLFFLNLWLTPLMLIALAIVLVGISWWNGWLDLQNTPRR